MPHTADKRWMFRTAEAYTRVLLQLSKADEGLQYYRLTLQLTHGLRNDTSKAIPYRGVGRALWYQGNFVKSVEMIKTSIIYFQKIDNKSQVCCKQTPTLYPMKEW